MSTRSAAAPNEQTEEATSVEDNSGYFHGFLQDVKDETGLNFMSTSFAATPGEETRPASAATPIPTSSGDKLSAQLSADLLREVEEKLSGHREELHAKLSEDSWQHRSQLDSHHDELYDKLVGCLLTSQAEFQQHLSHLDGHCQDLDGRLTETTSHIEGIATLVASRAAAEELARLADVVAGKAGAEDLHHTEAGLAEQRSALDAHRDLTAAQTAEASRQRKGLTESLQGVVSLGQFQELSDVVQCKVTADSFSELAAAVAAKASTEHLDRLEIVLSEETAGLENFRTELRAEISKAFAEQQPALDTKVAADSLSELADVVASKASSEQLGRLEVGLAEQTVGLEKVRKELRAEMSKLFAQFQPALDAQIQASRQRSELTESLQGFVSLGQFQGLSEIVQGKADHELQRQVLQSIEQQVSAQDIRCKDLRTQIDEMSQQHERFEKELDGRASVHRCEELVDLLQGKADSKDLQELVRAKENEYELLQRLAVLDQHSQESDAQILQCFAQLEALDASLQTKASAGELESFVDRSGRSSSEVRDLRTRLEHLHSQLLQSSGQQRSSMDVLREEQHARVDELARKHEQLSNIMRSMTKEFDDLVGTVETKASRGDLSARLRTNAHNRMLDHREAAAGIELTLPPEPVKGRGACCGLKPDVEDDAQSTTSVQPTGIEKSIKHIMASVDTGPKAFSIKPGVPKSRSVPRNYGSPRSPKT